MQWWHAVGKIKKKGIVRLDPRIDEGTVVLQEIAAKSFVQDGIWSSGRLLSLRCGKGMHLDNR